MDPQNLFLSDSEEEDLALSGLRFACLLVNARLHRSERRTTILSTSRKRHAAALALSKSATELSNLIQAFRSTHVLGSSY